jgi:hypothetical protein
MGKSFGTYVLHCARRGDRRLLADETWAIVAMGGVIQHDRLFLMDDIPHILAPLRPKMRHIDGMFGWLKNHPGPIYTSKAYPEYPGTVEYPLQAVCEAVGEAYFSTSVAYAIGYAIYLGVKELQLYGCDFTYPNRHEAETGRGCAEFLIAKAMGKGIRITVAQDSTLLGVSEPEWRLYGYKDPPKVSFGVK